MSNFAKSRTPFLASMASCAAIVACLSIFPGCEYPRQYTVYRSILEKDREFGTLRYSWTTVEWTRNQDGKWHKPVVIFLDLGEPLSLIREDYSWYRVVGRDGECRIYLDREKTRIIKQ